MFPSKNILPLACWASNPTQSKVVKMRSTKFSNGSVEVVLNDPSLSSTPLFVDPSILGLMCSSCNMTQPYIKISDFVYTLHLKGWHLTSAEYGLQANASTVPTFYQFSYCSM